MGTDQIAALTTAQVAALSNSQMAALAAAYPSPTLPVGYYSPIVLDLNDGGISTLGLNDGVQFDIAASGRQMNTGWIAGGDGLLVMLIPAGAN